VEYRRVPIHGRAVVVSFDLCSSSDIIEELTLCDGLEHLKHFLTELKRYLADAQKSLLFDPYKFTGDGWILLLPEPIDGKALFKFLQDLCVFFEREFRRQVLRYIGTPPTLVGLTFGIEMGPLVPMTMYSQQEYVGRALNVACRLQSAIKDNDKSPAYKALVSNNVYRTYLAFTSKKVKVFSVRRNLRNIRGGATFHCKKIELLNAKAT
jgi:class 3 adenylate cyclase